MKRFVLRDNVITAIIFICLTCCLLCVNLCLVGTSGTTYVSSNIYEGEEMKLSEYLTKIEKVILYKEGVSQTFLISDREYTLILNELEYLLEDAREMPALGVSLDDATRNEMKKDIWVELVFVESQVHNDMPFESWLINVAPDYSGFNIIRKYEDRYEGRCFYVDLMSGKTMKNLHDILSDISIE